SLLLVPVCRSTCWLALAVTLIDSGFATAGHQAPDLSKIERRIGKEPAYQGNPGYLLLAFGPGAEHKVSLVRDADTLYVDRHATGDLTRPECRVPGEADHFYERLFKAGDLELGGRRYADLQLAVSPAKGGFGSGLDEIPLFRDFLAAQPDGKLFDVSIDVPF